MRCSLLMAVLALAGCSSGSSSTASTAPPGPLEGRYEALGFDVLIAPTGDAFGLVQSFELNEDGFAFLELDDAIGPERITPVPGKRGLEYRSDNPMRGEITGSQLVVSDEERVLFLSDPATDAQMSVSITVSADPRADVEAGVLDSLRSNPRARTADYTGFYSR